MNISVLGSGWLGLELIKDCISRGYTVKASTTQPSKVPLLHEIGAQGFVVDIDKLSDVKPQFFQSDILIITITSKSITGFQELIPVIQNSTVQYVIYTSSTSVYSDIDGVVTEDDNREKRDHPFFHIESNLRSTLQENLTILRLGGLVGPNRNPGSFFAKGAPISSPLAPVNILHRDDCIAIIHKVIEHNAWGMTLNCCSDKHPPKGEYYTMAARASGYPIPEVQNENTNRGKIVSNIMVKKSLNYTFKYPDPMEMRYN